MKLEKLKQGVFVRGIIPDVLVEVIAVEKYGSDNLELTYKLPNGDVDNETLSRDDENRLEIIRPDRSWTFDGDGVIFRLVSEAKRIRLAHLFDPLLAVHSSNINPYPHQISAVYESMLPRQPLRFLLADDPGAGKTIMAGLLIKELMARGDLRRCLVVCPGTLAEQWQGELANRFQLQFQILTNEQVKLTPGDNWFAQHNLVIARLDQLSRNEDMQQQLKSLDSLWDMIVCDEAHKMSATYSGSELKYTKRYKLGELLSTLTRHFLLMTATPHNGKEADFQAFMALLDSDRFEGRFRDGVHHSDVSDLMRRMVKESLLEFDGKPLFPERIAHTLSFRLSEDETRLYEKVTSYVREEFNRAEALDKDKRVGTVGFALTILQRRLASSPEAIHRSLQRRRERLESRLKEIERSHRDGVDIESALHSKDSQLDTEFIDDWEDTPEAEREDVEKRILDRATAAGSIPELKVEIQTLKSLEDLAYEVKNSGKDQKWNELAGLLDEMFSKDGLVSDKISEPESSYNTRTNTNLKYSPQQKLVVFTEHRDTLDYLHRRIDTLLGRSNATVVIHGGVKREDRIKIQENFKHSPEVWVLLATDAAGEGINLQSAHLMVNYDLPWNPNRLEQRFGRIHRIGQAKVCHLWNLVAQGTREGDVYQTLLGKIEQIQETLGGKIFDVLGDVNFGGKSLRDLMIEAIRYGKRPDVLERLNTAVDNALDRDHLRNLIHKSALTPDVMNDERIQGIRQDMERAKARRLQPHYIESFFCEAFKIFNGQIRQREPNRYEIPTHIPIRIRNYDTFAGKGNRIRSRYKRIVFEKNLISPPGKIQAEFICPGHPLLDTVVALILDEHSNLLKRGAILIDERDFGKNPRILFYLEHAIRDGVSVGESSRRILSKRMLYVEIDEERNTRRLQYAPYLDYRPLKTTVENSSDSNPDPSLDLILESPQCSWISDSNVEKQAKAYAIENIAPEHLKEVKSERQRLIDKTKSEVKDRLTKEINHWDRRAAEIEAGIENKGTKLNASMARRQADDFRERLKKRMGDLKLEERIKSSPPIVSGGALVIPQGLLDDLRGSEPVSDRSSPDTQASAARAREITMEVERKLGFEPVDRENEKLGYDIESRMPDGRLRLIEVKGRISGASTITVTLNEILTSLNKPEDYILSIVEFLDDGGHKVHYVREPFQKDVNFEMTSVDYTTEKLLKRSQSPS